MAITGFIDVENLTYCGQQAGEIMSKDIYSLPLNEFITLKDGLKGKQKLYEGSLGNLWQEYTCAFTPDGEVVLSEDYIEPDAIKVNMEECYDKFWDTYLVEQTQISLQGGIPQTFSNWFFDRLRKQMSKEYDEMFWNGDKSYSGTKTYLKNTDGVIVKLETALAGAQSANLISGSTITVNNVISQVEAAVAQAIESAADAEVDTESFKIFMNHNDVRLLEIALGKDCSCNNINQVFNNYARNNGRIWIMGFEVVETLQERSTIIVGPGKNLVLGFDTYDSHLEYRLINLRDTTGDNAFRIIAISNIGVGIVNPTLFVLSKV